MFIGKSTSLFTLEKELNLNLKIITESTEKKYYTTEDFFSEVAKNNQDITKLQTIVSKFFNPDETKQADHDTAYSSADHDYAQNPEAETHTNFGGATTEHIDL